MNARTWVSAVALVAGLLAVERTAAAKPGIVVLGLEVRDLEANIDEKTTKLATELTAGLRAQAKGATSPYSLVPNAEAELTEVKVINMCDDEGLGCMSSIGKDMKADRLLYGRITKRKNGYQVSLDLLDVKKKEMERSASEIIPFADATSPGIGRWAKTLYGKLTGTAETGGTLLISANADNGEVFVDGKSKAKLVNGTARIGGLSEGSHTIGIQAPGYKTWAGEATVTAGETTKMTATLDKDGGGGPGPGPAPGPGPGLGDDDDDDDGGEKPMPGKVSRILFWTALLATAGSAAGATVTGLQVRGKLKDDQLAAVEALADRQTNPIQLDENNACSDAEARGGSDAGDRKSTRLNSSHSQISYAVFCLKK